MFKLAVKRMEQRKRGKESIQDIEDDAGPVFKRSRLAGAATYDIVMVVWATTPNTALLMAKLHSSSKRARPLHW